MGFREGLGKLFKGISGGGEGSRRKERPSALDPNFERDYPGDEARDVSKMGFPELAGFWNGMGNTTLNRTDGEWNQQIKDELVRRLSLLNEEERRARYKQNSMNPDELESLIAMVNKE